jgi:siroheme synthase (precorrin-2 oxidase/ferrochelatase)
MNQIDWKTKLTSRKFWVSLAAFVSQLIVVFGGAESDAVKITALIMAGATVIGYALAEGLVDSTRGGSNGDS